MRIIGKINHMRISRGLSIAGMFRMVEGVVALAGCLTPERSGCAEYELSKEGIKSESLI